MDFPLTPSKFFGHFLLTVISGSYQNSANFYSIFVLSPRLKCIYRVLSWVISRVIWNLHCVCIYGGKQNRTTLGVWRPWPYPKSSVFILLLWVLTVYHVHLWGTRIFWFWLQAYQRPSSESRILAILLLCYAKLCSPTWVCSKGERNPVVSRNSREAEASLETSSFHYSAYKLLLLEAYFSLDC